MKIVWIYPKSENCGIHIYSKHFIKLLTQKHSVISIYTNEFLKNNNYVRSIVKSADIVHIQFEISFFHNIGKLRIKNLFKNIKAPLFVTLHEVYDEFPGVFPKNKITGNLILKKLKEIKYDFFHRDSELLNYCYRSNFFSATIIVHHKYQIEIMSRKGIVAQKIDLPFLINARKSAPPQDRKIVRMGCSGFISRNYDWDLLFKVLKRVNFEWKFRWIGSFRRDEDRVLVNEINNLVEKYGFSDKFEISGWLTDEEFELEMEKLDIYAAFFRNKSTSTTLYHAIAKEIPTVATTSQLTKEVYDDSSAILLFTTIKECVELINAAINDKALIKHLKYNMRLMIDKYTIEHSTNQLIALYESAIK